MELAIIVLPAAFLMVFLGFLCIPWLTHREMTKDYTSQYGVGSYKDFVRQFKKVKWTRSRYNIKSSIFSEDQTDSYHASVIKFNGRGMIIKDPVSYAFVVLYVRKYIKTTFEDKRKVNEWR